MLRFAAFGLAVAAGFCLGAAAETKFPPASSSVVMGNLLGEKYANIGCSGEIPTISHLNFVGPDGDFVPPVLHLDGLFSKAACRYLPEHSPRAAR